MALREFIIDPVLGEWNKEKDYSRKYDKSVDMQIQRLNGIHSPQAGLGRMFVFDDYQTEINQFDSILEPKYDGYNNENDYSFIDNGHGGGGGSVQPLKVITSIPEPPKPAPVLTITKPVQTVVTPAPSVTQPVQTITPTASAGAAPVNYMVEPVKQISIKPQTTALPTNNTEEVSKKGYTTWILAGVAVLGTLALTEMTGITHITGIGKKANGSLNGISNGKTAKRTVKKTPSRTVKTASKTATQRKKTTAKSPTRSRKAVEVTL